MLELCLMGEVPEHWLRIFIHALLVNTSHLPNDVTHFNYELSPFFLKDHLPQSQFIFISVGKYALVLMYTFSDWFRSVSLKSLARPEAPRGCAASA